VRVPDVNASAVGHLNPARRSRRHARAATLALACGAAMCATFTWSGTARAADPEKVEWSPDWPRVRLVEGLTIVAATVASYSIDSFSTTPSRANWRGGILFDDWVRDGLRGRTLQSQERAAQISDYLYKGAVFAPYLIDVWITTLGIHQNADVALQMLLMNLQSLGISGVVTLAAERTVGRARPYVGDCGPDGNVRDAQGRVLFNHCDGVGDNQSFYSGHAAAVTTMAGLTCAHHQHLPLYGGGAADLAPCLVMIGLAATTGVTRIVADRHWASDVVLGWGLGAVSGYVLPSLLHYGFGHGRTVGQFDVAGVKLLPIPQAFDRGAGLGLFAIF
jgi:membrane-associated phospholipid phosphatase